MSKTKLSNLIDCSGLSCEKIDYEIKNLISYGFKRIILRNTNEKDYLLQDFKVNIRLEFIDSVGKLFANGICGVKVLINGSISDESASCAKDCKFTVFGSCGNSFGKNVQTSEFYIFDNCGKDSFCNLNSLSKVVVGGVIGGGFASNAKGGIVIILNLKGGSFFIDDSYFKEGKSDFIYVRGDCKSTANKFLVEKTDENDEDVYLPLISEFARLFDCALSEIKSKPFNRVSIK